MDPLELLRRKDKWFLGGGKGAIYAPPFPRFLTTPGFCDECYFADIRIPRLFSVLVMDSRSRPLRFESKVEDWRPDRLVLKHSAPGVVLRETRCVTESNAWASRFEVLVSMGPLHFFQWALLDVRPKGSGSPWTSLTDAAVLGGSVRVQFETAWPQDIAPDRTAVEVENLAQDDHMLDALPIFLELGGSVPRHSWTVNLAQRHDDSPLYELSMLPEKFRGGTLEEEFKLWVGPEPFEGLGHIVQHFMVEPGEDLVLACGAGLSPEDAGASLNSALTEDVVERNTEAWRTYFASVPQFSSSDPWLTAAYWYRWYGLRLNTVDVPGLSLRKVGESSELTFSPYVTEGIGFFRNFITYSAQTHLREVAWMHDPSLATGILDNLSSVLEEHGTLPGHNYSARSPRDFYHADFGTGMDRLNRLHGGEEDRGREMLGRYVDTLIFSRRTEGMGIAIHDQNETGQEYMSRYQWVSDTADKWHRVELVGVDATVYVYAMLSHLGRVEQAEEYRRYLEQMYDADVSYYCDRHPDTGELSPERPATGLYPLMLDLDIERAEEVAWKWLLSSDEFLLAEGLPATALSDSTFSADGEWKEKRLNCPWNGRSWPMANSHMVDAIANVARRSTSDRASELRVKAAEVFSKVIRLMFHDGDPSRPNCYEHYDPVTGMPALYRGYDDYMHSWIVDLILRHAVGVVPGEDEVDPFPVDTDWIECRDIPHAKGRMHVRIERGRAPEVTIEPR